MSTFKILRRANGNYYIGRTGTNFFVNGSGTPPVPVTGVPLSVANFSTSWNGDVISLPDRSKPCTDLNEQAAIDFVWDKNDPETDPVDFYILRRVHNIFIGDDTLPNGYPAGYDGEYCIANSQAPGPAAGNDFNTPFEPFGVTATSGTGGTFGAITVYPTGSSYGRWSYSHSTETPKYVNGLGIHSLEFNQTGPRLVFRDAESKSKFFQSIGGEVSQDDIPFFLYPNTGTAADHSFLYSAASEQGKFYLSTAGIADQGTDYIAFSNNMGSAYSELLSYLESAGVGNNYLYIQIGYDQTYEYLRTACLQAYTQIQKNPLILQREYLEALFPASSTYAWTLQDFECDNGIYSYQTLAVNYSGQSILPSPYAAADISLETSGWLAKEKTEARLQESGSFFLIRYGEANGFRDYFVVPPGYIATMIYASGWVYDSQGGLVTTASSSDTGGTGGFLYVSKPADGWYYAEAEEQWRLTGPSGEGLPTIHSVRCGNNYQFIQ